MDIHDYRYSKYSCLSFSGVNITFEATPVVVPYIPTYNYSSPQNELAFECRASMPSANQSYLFDIQWSIEGEVVADKTQMNFSSLREQGTLHRRDWDSERSKIIGIRVCILNCYSLIIVGNTRMTTIRYSLIIFGNTRMTTLQYFPLITLRPIETKASLHILDLANTIFSDSVT